jgi:hypothetical protein
MRIQELIHQFEEASLKFEDPNSLGQNMMNHFIGAAAPHFKLQTEYFKLAPSNFKLATSN